MNIKYPTEQDIIRINHYIIFKFSPEEQMGVKDMGMLASVVNLSKQFAFGEDAYPTVYDKAAALFQSIILNHPFYNANKRTALWSLIYFLKENNVELTEDQTKLEDFTLSIATDHLDIETISHWIKENSSKMNK